MPLINALRLYSGSCGSSPRGLAKRLKVAEIAGVRIGHGNESLRCYALPMGATVIRIIGIDPGLRRTGWGVVDSDGVRLSYVASGLVTSAADTDLAYRLRELFEGIASVIASFKPHEAAVEETFVNDNARSTLKLGQARGMALLAPAMGGLLVAEYPPNLIKKAVTGAGHAEKRQIEAMIGFLQPKARVQRPEEADALAIAICHANHRKSTRLAMALR